MESPPLYRLTNPVRIVTATALFDGHDVSINIMRRLLQDGGAEVIHLGHNRSVDEIATAAIQEDAHAIALSSYQGGHVEFFRYLVDQLEARGAGHIHVFGGGGGVIVPDEIRTIEGFGVRRIFSPEDGRRLGLHGIINTILEDIDHPHAWEIAEAEVSALNPADTLTLARLLSLAEGSESQRERLDALAPTLPQRITVPPVLGITGTGGAGKSSLVDELITRFLHDFEDKTVAVICIDPTRSRTGGALLGDRIRMNALQNPRVYMRSLATRGTQSEISEALEPTLKVIKAGGFDLILVETAGIGQGNAAIVRYADAFLYVMTAEFGAPTQLEKIDMLDYADLIAINKFDHRGGSDALRDVCKQVQRNRKAFDTPPEAMPVYGTIAARFNDDGVTTLYHGLLDCLNAKCNAGLESSLPRPNGRIPSDTTVVVPPKRVRYLSEVAETLRGYHAHVEEQAERLRMVWHLTSAHHMLKEGSPEVVAAVGAKIEEALQACGEEAVRLLSAFPELRSRYEADEFTYTVRNKEHRVPLKRASLSGTEVPRVALPRYHDHGDLVRWLMLENVPGQFPFTAGVFPLKRSDESPARMFAGEGDPARTNRRFKFLSKDAQANRLSTAFDSVTLYGEDPAEAPDIYGKVGTSGVSIATLDDMDVLYDGFDLCAPNTSVSMTINGPAPIILAMFFNTAIRQQIRFFESEQGRAPSGKEVEQLRARVFQSVRGTVQADILKEDQGQNTCIFSIDFALRMMGDIQEFFVANQVRNFYSISISGYHIAEAGANPISQLAFTLANAFTYVEYFIARGMSIDAVAPNLSFFFSLGMDPEYAVINRVARRIWAVAMREKYGANERSQKLKAHVQTSGRSLHAQEIQFNDIRTTLQALTALYDNCSSLHTNAFDEAITTPTPASVRRAQAIQQIINQEFGLYTNENALQGSFIIEELTALVEEAVLAEFDRLTDRGGVLGAMETGYQRGKIQDESLYYESKKADGSYPIIGVNTFLDPNADADAATGGVDLMRATEEEKKSQLRHLRGFQEAHRDTAPQALRRLQQTALNGGNLFVELLETTQHASLGQISHALYEVGGRYRRNL